MCTPTDWPLHQTSLTLNLRWLYRTSSRLLSAAASSAAASAVPARTHQWSKHIACAAMRTGMHGGRHDVRTQAIMPLHAQHCATACAVASPKHVSRPPPATCRTCARTHTRLVPTTTPAPTCARCLAPALLCGVGVHRDGRGRQVAGRRTLHAPCLRAVGTQASGTRARPCDVALVWRAAAPGPRQASKQLGLLACCSSCTACNERAAACK